MDLSRRQFVQIGGTAAAAAAVPGIDAGLAPRPGLAWAATTAAEMPEPDLPALLLNRAAFGPRPGEVEALRAAPNAAYDWIEAQLQPESIDDGEVEAQMAKLGTLGLPARLLLDYGNNRGQVVEELRLATIYRMAFSRRQLYEVMVEFWTDHFSMYHPAELCEYFKTVDDREVIRKHALGKFQDLLTASAMSPAMLNFLNNDTSTKVKPNENYAREIMELHTLGVARNGEPYTEQDVWEVARCFTGWSWDRRGTSPKRGDFEFRADDHDNGPKMVLGNPIGLNGYMEDGRIVIDILCHHEATSRYLATKMVRRFVADDPLGQVPELVDQVAETYRRTEGDIKEMVYTILTSAEFARSFGGFGGRLSRPMDYVARSLRALDVRIEHYPVDVRNSPLHNRIRNALTMMGHVPFQWPTPDGYPDHKEAWASSIGMLTRWNMGLSLCAAGAGSSPTGAEMVPGFRPHSQTPAELQTAGAIADYWIARLLHRAMRPEDRAVVIDYLTDGGSEATPRGPTLERRLPETIAVILDSPYFQWR